MTPTTGLPENIAAAVDRFATESRELTGRQLTRAEALDAIIRDWLIGHGYLEFPPEREDAS